MEGIRTKVELNVRAYFEEEDGGLVTMATYPESCMKEARAHKEHVEIFEDTQAIIEVVEVTYEVRHSIFPENRYKGISRRVIEVIKN